MAEEVHELSTEDLVIEEVEPGPAKMPALKHAGVSVTGAPSARPAASPAPARPRFVPSALSRPIKEKTRAQTPDKPVESPASLPAKAASFYDEAIEAHRGGDSAAAIRHVKMAITFDPGQPRYHELLKKLSAR